MSVPQYFAQIDDNNIVIAVHCVTRLFLEENPDRYPGLWVETFFDVPGKTYAGAGYTYDPSTGVFIAPKPFASWSLDANYDWQAPIALPADGKRYSWDEANQVWVESPAI
jgi:hypothetical protein